MTSALLKIVTLMFESQTNLKRFEMLINFEHIAVNLRQLTITIEWDESKIELAINAFNATVFDVGDRYPTFEWNNYLVSDIHHAVVQMSNNG